MCICWCKLIINNKNARWLVWERGEERCVQGLVARPEGKKPHGRPQRRWGIILKHV
jgi:hypothetical protein